MSVTPNPYAIQESLRYQTPISPTSQPFSGPYPQSFPHTLNRPGNEYDSRNAIDPEEEDENSDLNRRRRYAWAKQIIAEEKSRAAAHAQPKPLAVIPSHGDGFGPGPGNGLDYPYGKFEYG
jgi:hypothetical protein